MSRIAAVWRRDGTPLDASSLERVLSAMASRPADVVRTWVDGSVGLCEWQLTTTPESRRDAAARRSADGRVVLIADVRLDNRAELLAALGFAIADADEIADDVILLGAWERWGEACPTHLLGAFAFVVWDARRHVLFCARDHAGVRPLYYHIGPRVVAVASEPAALLALPDVPRVLDEVRIAAFLVPGLADRTRTFYEGISRLPAGHSLVVTQARGIPRPYWQLDPTRALALRSDREYADAFRELFTDAVRLRLRSAGPLAAALSGGLDSSSVVSVARALHEQAGLGLLRTYTARFPTITECDEGPYVAAVVRQGGLDARELRADLLDPLGDLDAARGPVDDGFKGASYYMHSALFRAARDGGANVFLEGMGGDMVVSHGTGHLHGLARSWRLHTLWRQARRLSQSGEQPIGRLLRRSAAASTPSWVRRAWQYVRHRGLTGPAMISPAFARRVQLDARLRAASAAEPDRRGLEPARYAHWRALTSPNVAHILETLAAASAAIGVEVRDPFMDRRLIEFCLSLPPSQKIRDGRTRVVMRHALAGMLPPEITNRRGKAPLNLMLTAALRAYGPDRLEGLMRESVERLAPYVNADAVRQVYRDVRAHPSELTRNRVWRLATLTFWLRRAV